MATYTGRIRRGLPRDHSGEPWPPVEQAPLDIVAVADTAVADPRGVAAEAAQDALVQSVASPAETASSAEKAEADVVRAAEAVLAEHVESTAAPEQEAQQPVTAANEVTQSEVSLRRGLPRVSGGEQWPPATSVTVSSSIPGAAVSATPAVTNPGNIADANQGLVAKTAVEESTSPDEASSPAIVSAETATSTALSGAAGSPSSLNVGTGEPLRRGLPRVAGGEAWPPTGFAPKAAPVVPASPAASQPVTQAPAVETAQAPTPAAPAVETASPTTPAVSQPKPVAMPATPSEVATPEAPVTPAPAAKPVAAKPAPASAPSAAAKPAAAKAEPKAAAKPAKIEAKLYGSRTLAQWARLVVLIAVGAVAAAGIIVLAARGLTTFTAVQSFLVRYPGEYELPATAEPGFPAWVRWSHFLNMFFIVLIIRSGLLVRRQQKPPAFWAPKNGKGAKISINLWLHQSLDLLWQINGVVFVALLFVTGHWMRIVPTSWEVFPNALSALIQYLTLEWPVEDGWVNYNSLQQLMYFTVVFIAAPLAAITGARLSDMWPKGAKRLNKIYPVEVARTLHFPTMLFFVFFVIMHVALVFSTGALKNLNHMYVGTPEVSWAGFWIFAGSIVVVALVWIASRPMILGPIASLFGKVSSR